MHLKMFLDHVTSSTGKYLIAMNKKLRSLKLQNIGQSLCEKGIPFCKFGHICLFTDTHSFYILG